MRIRKMWELLSRIKPFTRYERISSVKSYIQKTIITLISWKVVSSEISYQEDQETYRNYPSDSHHSRDMDPFLFWHHAQRINSQSSEKDRDEKYLFSMKLKMQRWNRSQVVSNTGGSLWKPHPVQWIRPLFHVQPLTAQLI